MKSTEINSMEKLRPFLRSFKVLLTCFIVISSFFTATAQYGNLPNILSPDVAQLGKYGAYPVNLYTGTPNISIPLYNLSYKGLDLSMSINYDASGLIPNKDAGIVGLNWNLLAGGVVTRVVSETPDDKSIPGPSAYPACGLINGILEKNLQKYDKEYIRNLSFLQINDQYFPNISLAYEVNPDIFSFNFYGHSGRFFMGNDGKIKVIADRQYKVDLTQLKGQYNVCSNYQNSQISIISDDGYTFVFGGEINTVEITVPGQFTGSPAIPDPSAGVIGAWYLSKVILPNGEEISYSYEPQEKNCFTQLITHASDNLTAHNYFIERVYKSQNLNFVVEGDITNGAGGITKGRSIIKTCYLKQISSSNFIIDFQYSARQKRFYGTSESFQYATLADKKLDNIIVNNKNQSLQKINFSYDYNGTDVMGYRMFLNQVTLNTGEGTKIGSYDFTYNKTISLPYPLTTGIDIWGYYNGKNANSYLVPLFTSGAPNYSMDLSHRAADNYSDIGLLQSIKYPTGGTTSFVYENHDYSKVFRRTMQSGIVPELFNESSKAGGVRIKEINESSGTSRKFKYVKNYLSNPSNASSGVLVDHNIFFMDLKFYYNSDVGDIRYLSVSDNNISASSTFSEAPLGYSEVTEINSEGYTVHYFSNFETNPDTYHLGTDSYKLTITPDNSYTNYTRQMERLYKYSGRDIERGKLNKDIYFNSNKDTVRIIQNEYNTDPLRINESVIGYVNTHGKGSWGLYQSFALYCYQNQLTKQSITDFSSPRITKTITNAYISNSSPYQRETKAINSSGEESIVRYRYPFDVTTESSTQYPIDTYPFTNLLKRNIIGFPFETISLRKEGTVEKTIKVELLTFQGVKPQKPDLTQASLLVPYKKYSLENTAGITNYVPFKINHNNYSTPETFLIDNNLKEKMIFSGYDYSGNIITAQVVDGTNTSYKWGYNKQYPIATCINAAENECYFEGFEDDLTAAAWGISHTGKRFNGGRDYLVPFSKPNTKTYKITWFQWDGTKWNYNEEIYTGSKTFSSSLFVDDIRIFPENAQMTTYTYEPLAGMTSSTDVKGFTVYYLYDEIQRLKFIKDQNGDILKEYCYNYANVNANSCLTYFNAALSISKTRDNCGVSGTGTQVTYTVPAGKYFSTVSQAAADAQAAADRDANAQFYANALGVCNPSTIYAKLFIENENDSFRKLSGDVIVRFYSDAACTIPKSVTNLTVNYKRTTYSGTTQSTSNYQTVCNGSNVTLVEQATLIGRDTNGNDTYIYEYELTASPDYNY